MVAVAVVSLVKSTKSGVVKTEQGRIYQLLGFNGATVLISGNVGKNADLSQLLASLNCAYLNQQLLVQFIVFRFVKSQPLPYTNWLPEV